MPQDDAVLRVYALEETVRSYGYRGQASDKPLLELFGNLSE